MYRIVVFWEWSSNLRSSGPVKSGRPLRFGVGRILHQTELFDDWKRAQARQPLNKIEPLE